LSKKRDGALVVGIVVLCVVGIATLQIAAKSGGGKSRGGRSEGRPTRYVDPTYGFSLMVDPRFADSTGPGGVRPGVVYYTKVWLASGSPVEGEQSLDYLGVTVMEQASAATEHELDATVRTALSHPREVAVRMGGDARILRLRAATVDGASATIVDAYMNDAVTGLRMRTCWTTVLLPRHTYVLMAYSTPETWRRNLPAFESMTASFRLPPDEP
jgi:hypothetical protein